MPFVNPTTPNLPDYLTFLFGVVGIPAVMLPSSSGTATGGSTTTLVDTTQTWTANQWAGSAVYDTVQGVAVTVASNTANTLTFSAPLPLPVAAGDGYWLMPTVVNTSFTVATDTVNDVLAQAAPSIYTLAVYNLATDRLINYATDIPQQTYFVDLRAMFKISTVSVGVSSSVNDGGTSVGILNPETMSLFTLQDLQTLKTPYGRQYMAWAQTYGPTLWGLS